MRRLAALAVFLVVYSANSLHGQTTDASLTGRVTDPSKAIIAGAKVVAINLGTNVRYEGATNGSGNYYVANLPPGTYRIEVEKTGFKTDIQTGVVLHVQDTIELNFEMALGSTSETITVTGGAPLVNMESGAVSTVVDRQFVENMPLNGRTFQTLIALTPGVVLTATSTIEPGQFSVNGQRADANYFSVDGVSANVGTGLSLLQSAGGALPALSALGTTSSLASVEAMQEFRVQTSSFAPEFGRTPGGQVSIVTRSGTNDFHGALFDYFRNDVLDANNWFADRSGLRKPEERQNDFGGVFGGPILRDRTFFFFSYEGLRLRQPLVQTTVVPSVASRQAAPPALQPFLNAYPVPNGPVLSGGFAQFMAGYSNPASLDAYGFRLDYTINSKLILFGRYSDSPSSTESRTATELSDVQILDFRTRTITVGLTSELGPRFGNELRTNYSNTRVSVRAFLDTFGGATPPSDSLLFPPGASSQANEFLFALIGAGNWGTGNLGGVTEQRQVNVLDNFTVAASRHKLKFGIDYRWLAPFTAPPGASYAALFTGLTGPKGLLAGIGSASIESLQPVALLSRNFSLYAQDSWKAGSRWSVTYGLRWDVTPPLEGRNAASQPFAVTGVASPATLAFAPRGTPIYQTSYHNVAPRLGVAYELFQTRGWETVLRGGGGVFYDLGIGSTGTFSASWPFTPVNFLGSVSFPLTQQQLVPPVINPNPPADGPAFVVDPGLTTPRTYQWNAALEQALGQNQAISATYVGAVGRDLLRQDNFLAPNPSFQATVSVTRNTATSDYHALQIQYQRRLALGLQARASYTWSHSIDIASNDSLTTNTPFFLNPSVDRGSSDFDSRHSFTAAATYDVPAGRMHGLARAILGNWSVDTLAMARSALPVNITATTFVTAATLYSARPNLVSGVPLYLFGPQYPGGKALNKAAFLTPAAGTQGNFGRNVLRAFNAWQIDFAVRRQFHLTEKLGLQVRAEFFNILNHPNFGPPTGSLTSPLFGLSGQTLANSMGAGGISGGLNPLYQIGGPRSGQLAVKFQF